MTRAVRSRFGVLGILLVGVIVGYLIARTNAPSLSSANETEVEPKTVQAAAQAKPARQSVLVTVSRT